MSLASDKLPTKDKHNWLCISAGEPLPSDLLERWQANLGLIFWMVWELQNKFLIFCLNRQDEITPLNTGRVVPGYQIRLINDEVIFVPPVKWVF